MRKRILTLFLLVVFCFSGMMFTACGGSSSNGEMDDATLNQKLDDFVDDAFKRAVNECNYGLLQTAPGGADFVVPEGGYDGSKVKIKFYHTMGKNLKDVLDEYIVKFNEIYPNIEVENTSVGGYDDVRDQINTEIAAGNQPNLAYCYPDHVALYNLAKATISIDNLIDDKNIGLTEEQKNDFIKGYYDEGKQFGDKKPGTDEGKMYTLPFSKSTEVLYYNKTFFDQNNLKVPTTWDEMEEVCKKIIELDPLSIPLGYDSESNWFITMCEQQKSPYTSASGDHFLFNNDENKKFVKRFYNWYQEGYVTTKEIFGGYTSGLFTNQDKTKPTSYMSIGSSAGATHQRPQKVDGAYPFEVGIASIPQVNPKDPKVISQGPSLCLFNKKNKQEVVASWLLVKYLTTSVEFQAKFSMASGYVPVLKSVAQNPAFKSFLEQADGSDFIAAQSAKVCMEQEAAYYASPAFNGSSKARDQVGQLLIKCMLAKLK